MSDTDAQSPPAICASCGGDIAGLSREDRCPLCGVKIAHLGGMPVPANLESTPIDEALEKELDPLHCPRCRYDRVGLARGAACPECGKVPGVPDHFPVARAFGVSRRIEHAIGCSSCGYNLRGLMSDGTCPECGSPIGPSLRPAYLRLSPPESLRRISRSLTLLMWAVPLSWGVLAIGGVLAGFAIGAGSAARETLRAIAAFGCIAACSFGTWLLSEPDFKGRSGRGARRGTLGHSQRGRRLCARAASVIAPACAFAWIIVVVSSAGRPELVEVSRGLAWLGLACLSVATASMVHILAYRADNPRLTKMARAAEATGGAMFALEILLFLGAVAAAKLGASSIGCFVIARLFAVVSVGLLVGAMLELSQQVRVYMRAGGGFGAPRAS
ncbi:MAG: hypothetical protein JNL50_05895 [Phycisphaerae bacterium]|nr:hypothetical protein [Phycisphaerae bacterium]